MSMPYFIPVIGFCCLALEQLDELDDRDDQNGETEGDGIFGDAYFSNSKACRRKGTKMTSVVSARLASAAQ